MKETYYFSHDYNSRSDNKIKRLILKHGFLGYGLFWAIIEDLYQNANALRTDYESIAYDLRTDENTIKSIINDFDLFVFDNDFFGSLSVQRRLEERISKSSKARESAYKRWNKNKEDANALQKQSECNAIKESKVKEIKEKEIKIKTKEEIDFAKQNFKQTLIPFLEKYGKDMLNDFFLHWTQVSKTGKLGWELEKTWSVEARLNTWSKRSFNKPNQPQIDKPIHTPNQKKRYEAN
jgi:hypothetical protein